jgi:hypothetical protein
MDGSLLETVAPGLKTFYRWCAVKINRHLIRDLNLLSTGWSDRQAAYQPEFADK